MTSLVKDIPDGYRGFDCNAAVSHAQAHLFAKAGFKFAARYLRRETQHSYDLTAGEVIGILEAGLAIFGVQHVESAESWVPSVEKGKRYGANAVDHAVKVGFPKGVAVVCDLEGVAPGTNRQVVLDYLREWYAPVKAAGFLPALYVGWHAGLNAADLYRLPFTRYWSAYNLNADQMPATRGVCLRQGVAKKGEKPAVPFEIDTNVARADLLGGRMPVLAPDEWGVI